jgi:hypothetical protein
MPVIKDDEILVRIRAASVNADVPVVVRGLHASADSGKA